MTQGNNTIDTTLATLTETIRAEERAKLQAEYAVKLSEVLGQPIGSPKRKMVAVTATVTPGKRVQKPVKKQGVGPSGQRSNDGRNLNCSQFVRTMPGVSPAEVVAAGEAVGLTFLESLVYQVRRNDALAAGKPVGKRGRPAGSKNKPKDAVVIIKNEDGTELRVDAATLAKFRKEQEAEEAAKAQVLANREAAKAEEAREKAEAEAKALAEAEAQKAALTVAEKPAEKPAEKKTDKSKGKKTEPKVEPKKAEPKKADKAKGKK